MIIWNIPVTSPSFALTYSAFVFVHDQASLSKEKKHKTKLKVFKKWNQETIGKYSAILHEKRAGLAYLRHQYALCVFISNKSGVLCFTLEDNETYLASVLIFKHRR